MQVSEELARRAKEILDDEAMREAFAILEQRCLSDFRNSAPDQIAVREWAHAQLNALASLKTQLASLADEPKVVAFKRRRKPPL